MIYKQRMRGIKCSRLPRANILIKKAKAIPINMIFFEDSTVDKNN
jgi:hypothetical protein